MISELKPYPVVKDSGVSWLGEVPEHWEVLPALAAYRPRKEKNTGMRETTVLSLSYGRIVVKPPEKLHGLVPESFETYQIVNPGNIVIRTTDLQNDQSSLRVGHSKHRGIITSAYMCLETAPSVDHAFGYQYLNTYDLLKIIYGFGSGLRQSLDFGDIKRMPVVVPPRSEQVAIVRFLDYADRRIRRYIRAKQKLIKLLKEQKQAIIHQAVTRGLDPSVPLKPSGIPWLGDIPKHWRTSRLSQLSTKIGDGLHGTPQYVDQSPYYFINGNNFVHGHIRLKSSTRCVSENEFKRYRVELDDSSVLISINGTIGSVACYQGESIILGKSAGYINCGKDLARPFLFSFLRSPAVTNFLRQEVTGTTIFNLSLASIRSLPISLPLLDEQLKIATAIEDMIAPVGSAISRLEREIELLHECRTRLIADVVTGKLDVRQAAASLPEELEPLEDAEADAESQDAVEEDLDAIAEEAET